jgi:hypothetical protein
MADLTPNSVTIDGTDISIEINIPEDFLSLSGFETALEEAIRASAIEARDFWVSEAGRRLKSSRAQYQQAISLDTVTKEAFTLKFSGGFLPYAMEVGVPGFDMNVRRGQIVPLNVDRQQPFTNPTVFRTGTGEPWKHPGFPGLNIVQDVLEELTNVILPKHINKALEEL